MNKRIWFMWLLCIFFISAGIQAQNEWRIIQEVIGTGPDYHSAKMNGLKKAMEQAYGIRLESKTKIENFELIADTILVTSSGFIQSYTEGDTIQNPNLTYSVKLYNVVVRESVQSIANEIAQISELLANANYPRMAIQQGKLNPKFFNEMEKFMLKMKVPLVADDSEDYQWLIVSTLKNVKGRLEIAGQMRTKDKNIISTTQFTLRFVGDEDTQYEPAATMMGINLLRQVLSTPIIKIYDLNTYLEAERVLEEIKKLDIVEHCSLKTYNDRTARYSVRIKKNLRELCSTLIKTGLFDRQKVELNEFERTLNLSYISSEITVASHKWLSAAQKNFVVTCPGKGKWSFQEDGNFVFYDAANRPVWHTRFLQVTEKGSVIIKSPTGAKWAFQDDGNFVFYGANGRPLWHTGILEVTEKGEVVLKRKGGGKWIFQEDGNLVFYGPDGRPIWWTQK